MKKCGIYGIRNIVNRKWYVGQSVNIGARTHNHFATLRSKKHYNIYLQRAFQKYSEDNFEVRILEEVQEDMLDVRERAWIAYYRSTDEQFGYNLQSGGSFGKHLSEETKQKISKANKGQIPWIEGRHHSDETRLKMSKARKGEKHSDEHKQKASEANKGKHHSEETKLKISKRLKGRKLSRKHRQKVIEALKGRKHSEETKLKMSEMKKGKPSSLKGRKLPVETKQKISETLMGHVSYWKGRKLSTEHKQKISVGHLRKDKK